MLSQFFLLIFLALSRIVLGGVASYDNFDEQNKLQFEAVTAVSGKIEHNRHHFKAASDNPSYPSAQYLDSSSNTKSEIEDLLFTEKFKDREDFASRHYNNAAGDGYPKRENFGSDGNENGGVGSYGVVTENEDFGSSGNNPKGYDSTYAAGRVPVNPSGYVITDNAKGGLSETNAKKYGSTNIAGRVPLTSAGYGSTGLGPFRPSSPGAYIPPSSGTNLSPTPSVNIPPSTGAFLPPNNSANSPPNVADGSSSNGAFVPPPQGGYGGGLSPPDASNYGNHSPQIPAAYLPTNTGSYGAYVPPPYPPYPYGGGDRNSFRHGPPDSPAGVDYHNPHSHHHHHQPHHHHHRHHHHHDGPPPSDNHAYQGPQGFRTLDHQFKVDSEYKEEGKHSGSFKELNSNGQCGYGSGFCGGYNGAFNKGY